MNRLTLLQRCLHRYVKAAVFAFTLAPSGALCDVYTWPDNGHGYYLDGTGTWNQCLAKAQTAGVHLVTVNDSAENAMLLSVFGSQVSEAWLGYAKYSGVFAWESGETPSYTNWNSGEPNNTGNAEHWALIMFWQSGKWNDYNLTSNCLMEVAVGPTPTPTAAPTSTATPTATPTPLPTATSTPAPTPTPTPTATPTPTPTATPTPQCKFYNIGNTTVCL